MSTAEHSRRGHPQLDHPLTLPALVASAARRWPDGLWVDFDGVGTSFGALAARVEEIACALHAYGLGPGSRVGLFMGNRPEWMQIQYAVAALGAWFVPLNTMMTAHELATVVGHAKLDTLVWAGEVLDADTTARLRDLLDLGVRPARIAGVGEADWPAGVDGWDGVLARGAAVDPGVVTATAAAVRPDDVVMVIYTSGTTGAPKGVLQTHRALAVSMHRWVRRLGLAPTDRSVFAAPLFWIHGCWHQSLIPLIAGSGILLERRFEAGRVLRRIVEGGCTHLQGVPFQYEQLLDHPDSALYDLSAVRTVQIGGSTLPPSLPGRVRERAPGAQFLAGYGLSEAGQVSYTPAGASIEDVATTIGTVHEGGAAAIVDPDDQITELAPGETGELLIKADCVMLGYLDAPEATAQALAGGWLHTGDLARVDDRGYLTILGRNQDAYKRSGAIVYTAEPEAVLAEHPGVEQASVVGVPDPERGQAGVAFVVRADRTLTAEMVLEHAAARLARYKVPAEVHFVDELPRTASGKIKKFELGKLVAATAGGVG